MNIVDQIKALAVRVGQEFGQYVSLHTDQTITGKKIFSESIVGDLTGTADKALSDANGNNIADSYMDLNSPQVITGQKTFVDMITADSLTLTGPDGIKYIYSDPNEDPDLGDDWDWSEWIGGASVINEVSPISTYSVERTSKVSTASLNTVMKLANEQPTVYASSPSVTLTQGIVTPTSADKNYKFRIAVTVGSATKEALQAGIDMTNGKLFLRYPNAIPDEDKTTQVATTEWVTNKINRINASTTFTKTEIEQMFNNLSNVYLTEETLQQYLNNNDVTVKNIYTKEEINNLLSNIDLSKYYTKTQIDNMINGLGSTYLTESTLQQYLSNNNTTIKNVYNKEEINQLINNIDLSAYYTKTEVDNLISGLSNTYLTESGLIQYLSNTDVTIKNVYTKEEITQLLNDIDLSNYYTKTQINQLMQELDTSVTNILSNYYTKTEVNNIISNIDLSNYYTKNEVDDLINNIDDSQYVKLTGNQTIAGTKTFKSTISGSIDGNAASATKVTQNVSTANNTYPILLSNTANATTNQTVTPIFGSGVKVNPSTSAVSATTFIGNLTGTATNATKDGSGNVITSTYATKDELQNVVIDDSNYVKTSGDQDIDGIKTFAKNVWTKSSYLIKKSNVTVGAYPTSNTYWSINFTDKNGTRISRILNYVNANGSSQAISLSLGDCVDVNNTGSLAVARNSAGNFYAAAPSYLADSTIGNNYIITAAMLRQLTGNTTLNAASADRATCDALGNEISATYATKEESGTYATKSELGAYLKSSDLNLSIYATKSELSNYVKSSDLNLSTYATKSELSNYATKTALGDYLKSSDLNLSTYATKSELSNYATKAELENIDVDTSKLVTTNTAQTISGAKTFTRGIESTSQLGFAIVRLNSNIERGTDTTKTTGGGSYAVYDANRKAIGSTDIWLEPGVGNSASMYCYNPADASDTSRAAIIVRWIAEGNKIYAEAPTYLGNLKSNSNVIATTAMLRQLTGNTSLNAASATKATCDALGNVINSTYATKEELNNVAIDDSAYVKTSGWQEIAGWKIFKEAICRRLPIEKGTAPASVTSYSLLTCYDTNSDNLTNNAHSFVGLSYKTFPSKGGQVLLRVTNNIAAGEEGATDIYFTFSCSNNGTGNLYLPDINDTANNSDTAITSKWLRTATGNTTLNAASATKATQDALGRVISDTYAPKTIITYGTTALTEGVSALASGCIYCQYEV